MPEADRSRFWLAAEFMLGCSLLVLPASMGGAPEWTAWLLHALASASLLLWSLGASRNHRRWQWHPAASVPVMLIVVGLVQLLPLPPGLLALVSPRQAELREFALLPLGLEAWRPIAVDAPAAARGVARLLSLAMLLFVALQLGRVDGVRRRLFGVLALSGGGTAVCGFGHLLAGADSLFGSWRFYGVVPFITPFGNTNHLAAWLLLTATIGLGLAMSASSRDAAVGWAVAASLTGVAVFLSYSRGGIASFVATWAVVGASVLMRRGGGLRDAFPWLAIGGTVLVAGLLSFDELLERAQTLSSLEKLQATKIELWPMFAEGLRPYWVAGMGLGGFELGFAPAQTSEFTVSFTHPESFWLQWIADIGLPLAVLLGAVSSRRALTLARTVWPMSLERAALVALGGLLLHDAFDFALELNALAPAVAIVLGLLLASEGSVVSKVAVRRIGLSLSAVPIVVGLALLTWALPGYLTDEVALQAMVSSGKSPLVLRERAVRLIDRHPADWVLFSTVAQDAARRAEPLEALAWINRVLWFRPADVTSHLAAAQALLRLRKVDQALGELRLAWARGDERSIALGIELVRSSGTWERLLVDRPGHLSAVYRMLRSANRAGETTALLEAAAGFAASPLVEQEASILSVEHEVELGAPASALERLDRLSPELGSTTPIVLARVRALQKLGRDEEAIRVLERHVSRNPGDAAVSFVLVDALSSMHRRAAARDELRRVRPFLFTAPLRSAVFQKEAALWLADDRYSPAIDALQTASRIEPTNPGLHYRLAEVYERMGSLHTALDEVRRGRLLDTPEGARAQDAWVHRLESAIVPLP